MNIDSVIDIFGGPDVTQERLESASSASAVLGTCVALVGDDGTTAFGYGYDRHGRPLSSATPVGVSCVAKLYVATLVSALLENGAVRLDDCIARHVDLDARGDYFDGITVRHLLSHTDGIGYRAFGKTPVDAAGFIDVPALAAAICSDLRTFPPGTYCTEGHFGFALLGALVEARLRRPLGAVLRCELLDLLKPQGRKDGDGRLEHPQRICPASGAGLALSALELAELLRLHLAPDTFRVPFLGSAGHLSKMFEPQGEYPGWAPSTKGCALGWKTFDGGWFGHNGVSPGQTVFVRLHPSKGLGLVFVCTSEASAAYAAFGRFLGESIPELAMRKGPSLLSGDELEDFDISQYVGVFGNRVRRIVVSGRSPRDLRVATSEPASTTCGVGQLLPAQDDSFFIGRPNTSGMFFVQYLRPPASDGLDLLWDIRALWQRRGDVSRAS